LNQKGVLFHSWQLRKRHKFWSSSNKFSALLILTGLYAQNRARNSNGTREGSVLASSCWVVSVVFFSSCLALTALRALAIIRQTPAVQAAGGRYCRLLLSSESPTSKTQHSGRFCMILSKNKSFLCPCKLMKFD
jgi:hypothetical protein